MPLNNNGVNRWKVYHLLLINLLLLFNSIFSCRNFIHCNFMKLLIRQNLLRQGKDANIWHKRYVVYDLHYFYYVFALCITWAHRLFDSVCILIEVMIYIYIDIEIGEVCSCLVLIACMCCYPFLNYNYAL